jgi:hypothetical protein
MLSGQWSERVCRVRGQLSATERPFLGRRRSVLIVRARAGHSLAIGRAHPIGRDAAAHMHHPEWGLCPLALRTCTGALRSESSPLLRTPTRSRFSDGHADEPVQDSRFFFFILASRRPANFPTGWGRKRCRFLPGRGATCWRRDARPDSLGVGLRKRRDPVPSCHLDNKNFVRQVQKTNC